MLINHIRTDSMQLYCILLAIRLLFVNKLELS